MMSGEEGALRSATGRTVAAVAALAAAFGGDASALARAGSPEREIAESRSGALAGLSVVEARRCPALGETGYVEGIADSTQLRNARLGEIDFVRSGLSSLGQMAGDGRLSAAGRQQLMALGSWNVVSSLTNWTMLTIAEQALVDPQVVPGGPFPLSLIDSASAEMSRLDLRYLAPEAGAAVQRLRTALGRCAATSYQSLLVRNESSFASEVERARSTEELNALAARYQLSRASTEPAAKAFLDRIEARRAKLAALVRAPRAPAGTRPAGVGAAAFTPVQMETARRFARAASSGNEQGALKELAEDVVMSTPSGTYRGRNEVAAAVREQNKSGKSGSMGEPFGDARGIGMRGRVGSFGVTSRLGFNAENKINRINVSLGSN